MGRDASEGKGPQRRPQKRLGRRLEEVAKAVAGGYCRLQMPLRPAFWRQGDRSQCIPGDGGRLWAVGCRTSCHPVHWGMTHPPTSHPTAFQGAAELLDPRGKHRCRGLALRVAGLSVRNEPFLFFSP